MRGLKEVYRIDISKQPQNNQPTMFSEEYDQQAVANNIIAMNPTGMVERFEGGDGSDHDMSTERTEMNDMGRRLKCTGDMCVIDDSEIAEKMSGMAQTAAPKTSSSPSYMTYLIYLVIALLVCAGLYVAYKKFYCKEWAFAA